MAWDDRRYYYRSRREGRRVVREYVGNGSEAKAAAQLDELERERREAERLALRHEKQQLDALDERLANLDVAVELAVHAAMTAAGFHKHHRSEWRRKRNGSVDGEARSEGA